MALAYGTSTPLTITAGSLGNGAARSSAAVTTSTANNIAAIFLTVNILTTATAPTGNAVYRVYGYVSEDGSTYSGASSVVDNVDGTDKALTALGSPTNLKLIGYIAANQGANAITIHGEFEITGPMGGIFPKWGIVLYNDSGTALGATVTATYREQYYT